MDAYERGKRAGRLEGYEMAVVAYLLTLQNMFELEADDLYKLSMNVNLELSRIIKKGEQYYKRIKAQLHDDYGITFKWQEKEKQSKKVSDMPLLEREQMRKAMLDMLEQKYYETHPNNLAPGKEQNSDGL